MLTAGVSFALGQFVVSNYVGPELTASLSALFSLTSVVLLLKVWRPREEFVEHAVALQASPPSSMRRRAWPARTAPTAS